jgi:hypothetical protein
MKRIPHWLIALGLGLILLIVGCALVYYQPWFKPEIVKMEAPTTPPVPPGPPRASASKPSPKPSPPQRSPSKP